MRLVPFLLSGLLLGAQAPGRLPWDGAAALPWKAGDCAQAPVPAALAPDLASGPLRVTVSADGALRIIDDRGMILLRTGLPGRPVRLWRDGGIPVATAAGTLRFPKDSPIARGIGALPVGSQDFRPALAGLLWILADDGRTLTVVHPATARLCYLPLPGGRDLQLQFHPDHLELREAAEACWSLPWLALLPQFILLGQENPANRPSGTALVPYPRS